MTTAKADGPGPDLGGYDMPIRGRVEALPKWAQEHIAALTERLGEAVANLRAIEDGSMASGVYAENRYRKGVLGIPDDYVLVIELGPRQRMEFRRVAGPSGGVRVRVFLTGGNLCVRPSGSNSLSLAAAEDRP